jgi:hypothetical protein
VTIDLADGGDVDCSFTNEVQGPLVDAEITAQTVQYSDLIQPVTITADDSGNDTLSAATSWSSDGVTFVSGLPAGLTLGAPSCTTNNGVQTCNWSIEGAIGEPQGIYTIRTTVSDDHSNTDDVDITIEVLKENATIDFKENNPMAVEVTESGGDSQPFSLFVEVFETQPDLPEGMGAPGDISLAGVSMTLYPVGPGGPITGTCAPDGVDGTGYDAKHIIQCDFVDAPVNTYTVEAIVVGEYYIGNNEDVLVVYDPSLGFTTGGGWFNWPGTEDKTSFGYTMKYNKKGNKVKGSLLLIRHAAPGEKYRVKSNALYGLALGEGDGFGWASFSGKAIYMEPGWPEPEGNHTFIVYVEDHGQSGDQIWIEVQDKDGNVIGVMSLNREAVDNHVPIERGNIIVPH